MVGGHYTNSTDVLCAPIRAVSSHECAFERSANRPPQTQSLKSKQPPTFPAAVIIGKHSNQFMTTAQSADAIACVPDLIAMGTDATGSDVIEAMPNETN